MPDVLFDMTPLDCPSRFRGIGRYVVQLAEGLAELSASDRHGLEIVGLTRLSGRVDKALDPSLAYRGDPGLTPSSFRYQRYRVMRRIAMGTLAKNARARLLHLTEARATPFDSRVPRIVTCHDLIPLVMHREYLGRIPGARWRRRLRERLRYLSAKRIIAISQTTRADLVELLGLPNERIDVVSHGIDHRRFHPRAAANEVDTLRAELGIARPFLLYVGAGDKRKNLPLLMDAYARSGVADEYDLVCAGSLSPPQASRAHAAVESFGVKRSVRWVGFVHDELLPMLYRQCTLHVFPSIAEGFGFPVLEAMACGASTLAARTPVLAEIAEGAADEFDVQSSGELSRALTRLVSDTEHRDHLRERGIAQARKFTWHRCAVETVASYCRALG